MEIVNYLIAFGLIHCALFFFNTIFQTCSHYPYYLFMENTGLEIKIFSIKWFTERLNRQIFRWSMARPKFWTLWFNIGVFVSVVILLPVALFTMMKMTLAWWTENTAQIANPSWTLEPMIPGVNVPLADIKYQIITLGLCSIIHEFGHALAASREDVQLYGIGLVLMYIVPIAFVSLNDNQLRKIPTQAQLRILCAGVWHNIVLAAVAAFIFFITPWLWLPLFNSNAGIYVKSIDANSPLLGAKGLLEGDVITSLNDCSVKSDKDWYFCVLQSLERPTPGYCVTQTTIEKYNDHLAIITDDNGTVNCCSSSSLAQGNICFKYIPSFPSNSNKIPSYACLPARTMIHQSEQQCQSTLDCIAGKSYCIKPSIHNATKIVQLFRENGEDVIFLGRPADIYRTVEISNWIPRFNLKTDIPEGMQLLCKYVAVLSAGLAVVNIIPCFFFDGHHICTLLIEYFFKSLLRKSTQHLVTLVVTSLGTLVLALNLVHSIINM